jgi:hypothetical protein
MGYLPFGSVAHRLSSGEAVGRWLGQVGVDCARSARSSAMSARLRRQGSQRQIQFW